MGSLPLLTTTVGIVSVTDEYIQCNGMYGGMIDAVDLVNAGCGYTVEPMVVISPSGNDIGSGGDTSGISTNGSIQFVTITGGGSGYTTNPNMTFVVGGGNTLLLSPLVYGYGVINNAGVVTAGYIRYGGDNYNLTGLSTITSVVVDIQLEWVPLLVLEHSSSMKLYLVVHLVQRQESTLG